MDIIMERLNPPVAPKESFKGRTVLVTGSNTGLGFEAAKKIAALDADRLIITTRSVPKGETAKAQIKQWLLDNNSASQTEILPLVLDMSSSQGVKSFLRDLKASTSRLDAVILNAGISVPRYQKSVDDFEETMQVNTVSTIFLATLLLPMLLSTAKYSAKRPVLTLVSSRNSMMKISVPTREDVLKSTTPVKATSEESAFPAGMTGGFVQYGRSKLFLEYAMRRLVQLPTLKDKNGKPIVIVNSVCPGATKSDLGRHWDSLLARILATVVFAVFAKSTAGGANAYLQALALDEGSMGKLWGSSKLMPEWEAITSEEGKQLGDHVWDELKDLIVQWDSSLAEILDHKSAV